MNRKDFIKGVAITSLATNTIDGSLKNKEDIITFTTPKNKQGRIINKTTPIDLTLYREEIEHHIIEEVNKQLLIQVGGEKEVDWDYFLVNPKSPCLKNWERDHPDIKVEFNWRPDFGMMFARADDYLSRFPKLFGTDRHEEVYNYYERMLSDFVGFLQKKGIVKNIKFDKRGSPALVLEKVADKHHLYFSEYSKTFLNA